MKGYTMKVCPICSINFEAKYKNRVFCSQNCISKSFYKRDKKDLVCKICLKNFKANKRKVYCSNECRGLSRLILNRNSRKITNEMVGEKYNKLIVLKENLTKK